MTAADGLVLVGIVFPVVIVGGFMGLLLAGEWIYDRIKYGKE